jgi:protein transport protein SEC13
MNIQDFVIDTQHSDVIHDNQFDYYGQFLATASSDRTVKIFAVDGVNKTLKANLIGHEGPVFMVAWAHPRFGNVVASCSYDRRVIVWKETAADQWKPVHLVGIHQASVNGIAWAPQQLGAILAAASSDGSISVSSCAGSLWSEPIRVSLPSGAAHPMGATAVSFAPFRTSDPCALVLASCGCDGLVQLWQRQGDGMAQLREAPFKEHTDWVRDVAFSPDGASPFAYVASCGQDKRVVIRRTRAERLCDPSADWDISVTSLDDGAWRLSWSTCGTMLLVTTSDSEAVILSEPPNFTDPWIKRTLSGQ